MKRSIVALAAVVFVSACGTREYETAPAGRPHPAAQDSGAPPRHERSRPGAPPGPIRAGHLWRCDVPSEQLATLRCHLADSPRVNRFESFGAAILGGAAIGLVIHASDSWFFGQPVEPGSGHWLWAHLNQWVKTAGQGVVRGGLFGGVCSALLSGWNLLEFDGISGPDYSALSTAITLGGLSALAAAPQMRRLFHTLKQPVAATPIFANDAAAPMDSPPSLRRGRWLRLTPELLALGLGSGVGLLVFDWLQDGGLRTETECAVVTK